MAVRRRGSQARRRPDRRVDVDAPGSRHHQKFETLVADALDSLPEGVQKLLENVAIVIEDEPTADQLRENRLRDTDTMYGLYEGVSPIAYGAGMVPFPNKITIFRLPLEEDFPDPKDLSREVQKTVLHELGHHAGMDDPRLHLMGF